jgi:nicotinamidase-related amidase
MIDRKDLATQLDEQFINVDPLRPSYREALDERAERFVSELHDRTALLCIDMQYLDAARGHGVFKDAESSGVPLEAQEYYFSTLEQLVLPNVGRLQAAFRQRGLEVIHTRIMSLTQDGRDRGAQHKRLGLHAAPGSKDAEFLPEVAPVGDEIVLSKTASGVFTSTTLELVLRNLGVEALVVCGVYTDECVSTTVRHASDLGFDTILVEDACTCVTEERHRFTVGTLSNRYVRVLTTEQVLAQLREQAEAAIESETAEAGE